MATPTGILWAGAILDRGGYGNVSRNYVFALRSAGIPVRTFNLGHVHGEVDPEAAALIREHATTDVGDAPLGIVHSLPSFLPQVRFRGVSGTVSASIFETHSLPAPWVDLSNTADQVWVPTKFNINTYAGAGVRKDKLRLIPIPIDCAYFHPGIAPRPIPGASGFVFLYVFSFGWRKGVDLLLRAYLEEFGPKDDVTLVLKVYQGHPWMPDLRQAVLRVPSGAPDPSAPGAPKVVVLPGPIPQDELRSLYASCDCYVSTDRANGWGMPCMEAMSMGKAAATIDWSGSTEFMTEDNALLIRPRPELEPVDPRLAESNPVVYAGQKWAAVDVAEVRRVLRRAFEDRALLKEKGARAAADMRERFSFEAIGRRFRELVETFPAAPPRRRGRPQASFHWRTRLRRAIANALRKVAPRLRT